VKAAFEQAWPAFALVAGLLLIGATAAREGLFAAAGSFVARAPGGAFALLAALLLVEAVVTAVLNLDTAVVFMTPVLLHAARARGLREDPFLYGAVFMANSASLLLPGSNLTNLIVLAHEHHVDGTTFAARLAPAWCVSVALTIAFVALLRGEVHPEPYEPPSFSPRLGTAATAVAAVLVLVLARPALPVLVLGAVNPPLLAGMLAIAVLLGSIAPGPVHLGRWATAWLAAGASVVVNNLPAAMLLSAHPPAHPRALLLGLDLGPNLAVTGSLSALFWLQVARANGARPSIRRYSLYGVVLVPLTLCASLLVTRL
jgi:arsenical pump membrane protein